MPRLLQAGVRPGPHGGQHQRRHHQVEHEREPRPKYERPEHPLTEDAQLKFSNMSQQLASRKYEHHLQKSIALLNDSIGPMNEAVADRRHEIGEQEKKRLVRSRETGDEVAKTEKQLHTEKLLVDTSRQVEEKTVEMEKALRQIIDYRVEITDTETAIANAAERTQARIEAFGQEKHRIENENRQRERRRRKKEAAKLEQQQKQKRSKLNREEKEDEEDAEDQPPPQDEESDDADLEFVEAEEQQFVHPLMAFKEVRKAQKAEYEKASVFNKYAEDNDYIGFRKSLHDAQYPREEKTMPSARHWFGRDGEPAHLIPNGANGGGQEGGDEDDEDDDLVVAGENRDYKCPLSMTTLKNPVTSRKCPHSFEKTAFADYLNQNDGGATCPVSGCSAALRRSDVYDDAVLKRKIERVQRIAKQEEEDDDEDDDDEASPPGSNLEGQI